MSNSFGATSTTDEVLQGVNLSGKRVLVTGVSAGLGVETARALAAHGAQVVGAARDLSKAQAATEQVRTQAASGGSLSLVQLDLASLDSVRRCADGLLAAGKPFDIIIANAGVMACPKGTTADGFETQLGTNHLGHFVLVNRIASLLKPGSRLVNLSSAGHRYADVDLEDPNFEHSPYAEFIAYGRSKTANVLFAVEFDRRHKARGVRATALHPGGIRTELSRHLSPAALQKLIADINARQPKGARANFSYKSIPARRQRHPSGLPASRTPQRLAVAIAKTVTWPKSPQTLPYARAYSPTPSIQSTHRRCGARAKRWSVSALP